MKCSTALCSAITVWLVIFLGYLELGSAQDADVSSVESPRSRFDKPSSRTPATRWHYGCELFQLLFEQAGLELTSDLDSCLDAPRSSVIVLLGRIDGTYSSQRLLRYMREGGRLLLATDNRCRIERLGTINGRYISSGRVESRYQGFNDVLRIDTVNRKHPLMSGVSELVVNRSSWIDLLSVGVPFNVATAAPSWAVPRASMGRPILGTCQFSPASRIVIAADHSLFINGMLWHGDNALLAINTCNYLTEGNRKRLVIIQDGLTLKSFQAQLPGLPDKVPEIPADVNPELNARQLLQVLNKTVAKAEDADLLNALLVDRPRSIPKRYYHRGLLFVLAAALLVIALLFLLSRSAVVASPKGPRRMRPQAALGIGNINIKHPDGVRRAEAARDLASDFLTKLTGSSEPRDWHMYVSQNLQQRLTTAEILGAQSAKETMATGSKGSSTTAARRGPADTTDTVKSLSLIVKTAESLDTRPISRKALLEFHRRLSHLRNRLDLSVATTSPAKTRIS